MKISIGSKFYDYPWGGGNFFIKNLSDYLASEGYEIRYDLLEKDLDIILLIDPRVSSQNSTFSHKDILRYKKYVNPNVKVVHRINECDQRKNTKGVNLYYIEANKVADHTVFVSNWLREIYQNDGYKSSSFSVIMSGSDELIFNNKDFKNWNKENKFKLVTHHWGNNINKGYQVYKKIDMLLDDPLWNKKIEFTFIGNLHQSIKFKNVKHILPLAGLDLAKEIKKNNAYITASVNEPSGNHHIESSQCGLPLLYINSGGIPEFAGNYGIEFTEDNLEEKILHLMNNYSEYYELMKLYPFSSKKMCKDYEKLFLDITYRNANSRKTIKKNKILFNTIYRLKIIFKFNPFFKFFYKNYLSILFILSKNKDSL